MNGRHRPVLLAETVRLLDVRPGEIIFDGTVGAGGHAAALLERAGPGGRLVGMDVDPAALELARARLAEFGDRAHLHQGNFAEFEQVLAIEGLATVDVALVDVGVSSMQLDEAERGFSFQQSGPLDMRMDPSAPMTAAEVVNELPESELADVIYRFGEERLSRRIARRIVEARTSSPIRTTEELARIVLSAQPGGGRKWQRIHPATRTFQALRIYVNRELESLEQFCGSIIDRLSEGGRVAVISFHSLEDRIVKQTFREASRARRVELLTRKPVEADEAEESENPRSRSAKLRVVRRLTAEESRIKRLGKYGRERADEHDEQ